MKQERKKDIKKMIQKMNQETMFMSSTTAIFENKHFHKLEKMVNNTNNKERLFKIIQNQLKINIFLYKLLENITGQTTIIKDEDKGRMNKIFEFLNTYRY